MKALLSRKRARIDSDDDLDYHGRAEISKNSSRIEHREFAPPPSSAPTSASGVANLKKSKTQGELEELDIVPASEAWKIDIDSMLASPTVETFEIEGKTREAHSNVQRYGKGGSIVVLCVQGNVQLHYDLLCALLPTLYALAPSLQPLVLCRDPHTHIPSTTTPFSLPLIQGAQGSVNHFVRLGLLHPLGGGHFPLDALVVLDQRGRRRLVLPFGWGAGKHAATPAGKGVQREMMGKLRACVEVLAREG